jgi:hypothetical protein
MRRAFLLLMLLATLPGCGGKWSWTGSATVEPGQSATTLLAPPSRDIEQRYRLHVKTSGGPVSIHVVSESDEPVALERLREGKKPSCPTLAQPASGVEEMVLALRQAPPTGKMAVILTNAGKQSVQATFRAEER